MQSSAQDVDQSRTELYKLINVLYPALVSPFPHSSCGENVRLGSPDLTRRKAPSNLRRVSNPSEPIPMDKLKLSRTRLAMLRWSTCYSKTE
jgi:hypothetical protein